MLSGMLAIIIFSISRDTELILNQGPLMLALAFGAEIVLGIFMGMAFQLLFEFFLLAGQVFDYQIGFGFVNVVNPTTNSQASLLSGFFNLVAVTLFLVMNLHHRLLMAFYHSMESFPLANWAFTPMHGQRILDVSVQIWVIGMELLLPLMLPILVADVLIGLLGKVVPQFQIIVVGFPIKIMFGMLALFSMLGFVMMSGMEKLSELMTWVEGMFYGQ